MLTDVPVSYMQNLAQDLCVYASKGVGVSVTVIVSDPRRTTLHLDNKVQWVAIAVLVTNLQCENVYNLFSC